MIGPESVNARRVLVVDDNEGIHADIRKILGGPASSASLDEAERMLFGEGASAPLTADAFEVDSAICGEDGFALVKASVEASRPYSLAFVDMRMPPGWDGLETIEHIWSVDPDIQIVVCTAYSDRSWLEMVEVLGRTDRLLILKKPFETVEVMQAATALAEKWKLTRQARHQLAHLDRLVAERTGELSAANDALRKEIDVRIDAEQRLHRAAMYDSLTGLPNRAQLIDRLQACIERAHRRSDFTFAVLFFDLDNFKIINDSLGHAAGDQLLVEVANRLSACVRSNDHLCIHEASAGRLGGDEFVVILEEIPGAAAAVAVAERLQEELSKPFEIDEQVITMSASIGIALSDPALPTPCDLLRGADTAMYRAKQAGKACHAIFDQKMHGEVMERLKLENDLRRAQDQGEFSVVYQPVVSLTDGRIAGFEALLRWRRSDGEAVEPDKFIPIAEEIGVIEALGRWTLDQACRQVVLWNNRLASDRQIFVAVNVSGRQLASPAFCDDVRNLIQSTGIAPERLHLEVTENAVIGGPVVAARALRSLKALGVSNHLDDFGTGHSSLSCLYDLPLDAIKIDRTFVYQAQKHREYAAVIAAVMLLARNLNMAVVAEGVETRDQLAQILAFDCDLAQGYYFSRPLDAAAAWDMLSADQPCYLPAAASVH